MECYYFNVVDLKNFSLTGKGLFLILKVYHQELPFTESML